MKKALLVSDSHMMNDDMLDVVRILGDEVEAVFHMGDIVGAESLLMNATSHIGALCYIVKGNCDRNHALKESNLIEFAGKRIVTCHGHLFGGYGGPDIDALRYFGQENQADVVVFGHIHRPYLEDFGDLIVCNPGSISQPRQEDRKKTFAVLEVDDELRVKHYSIEDGRIEKYKAVGGA